MIELVVSSWQNSWHLCGDRVRDIYTVTEFVTFIWWESSWHLYERDLDLGLGLWSRGFCSSIFCVSTHWRSTSTVWIHCHSESTSTPNTLALPLPLRMHLHSESTSTPNPLRWQSSWHLYDERVRDRMHFHTESTSTPNTLALPLPLRMHLHSERTPECASTPTSSIITQMSRTLSSTYHQLYHLYVTNSIII